MRSGDEIFEFDSENDEIETEYDANYPEDEDEDENALWDDGEDTADADTEIELTSKAQRQIARERRLIDELEADAAENPIEDENSDEDSERKKLKRELQAEALARLEDAARTVSDFEKVVAWWDKLDANRERRERYHELSRSGDDLPLDYGAAKDGLFFPDTLNDVLEKQLRKGDFIDAIFYCPYDIHELVTEENLSDILLELSEDHKELLFLYAVRLFSSTRIAAIRGQTDRNIRKVRVTMLKKIQKKLLPALLEKAKKQQPLTLLEKDFLADNSTEVDSQKKK
ncbi:sigma-70 family RNA polymerase sigma factor [Dysosmobacter welbionis]